MDESVKYKLRLAPCGESDLERMESWLTDLSASGLHLSGEGFWGSIGYFEPGEPKQVRYRLEAMPKRRAADESPETDARELMESMGWSFVAHRGRFYIYRSEDAAAPELHTDPTVQAATLKAIRANERGNLLSAVYFALLYPLLLSWNRQLMAMLAVGSGLMLLGLTADAVYILSAIRRCVIFSRIRRKLAQGRELEHSKPWKPNAWRHILGRYVTVALIIVFFVLAIGGWLSRQEGTPLSDYHEPLPFPTLHQLAPDCEYEPVAYFETNEIKVRQDLLAPVMVELSESALLTPQAGGGNSVIQKVDYYELRTPWLAHRAAVEVTRYWRKQGKKYYHDGQTELALDCQSFDYAVWLHNESWSDTLILQKGCKTVVCELIIFDDPLITPNDWALAMAAYME